MRSSVSDLVSATKPIIAFSGNSVQKGYTYILLLVSPENVSLVLVGSPIFIFCLETQMNF